ISLNQPISEEDLYNTLTYDKTYVKPNLEHLMHYNLIAEEDGLINVQRKTSPPYVFYVNLIRGLLMDYRTVATNKDLAFSLCTEALTGLLDQYAQLSNCTTQAEVEKLKYKIRTHQNSVEYQSLRRLIFAFENLDQAVSLPIAKNLANQIRETEG